MCEHVGGGDSLEWERHLSIFAIILTLEVAHAGISICLLSDIKPRDTLHRNLEECLTPMQREAWLLRALCPYNGMLQSCMVVTGPHMHAANCRNCWWTNSVSWQCILSPQASQAGLRDCAGASIEYDDAKQCCSTFYLFWVSPTTFPKELIQLYLLRRASLHEHNLGTPCYCVSHKF
eukprot:1153081-Pelagomonas_calceolata.AAC.3